MPQARCVRPPPTTQRAAWAPDNMRARFLLLTQTLLWLVAAAGSSLLVYWLYIDPVYGPHWSLKPGALLFTLLGAYAGAGCMISLLDILRRV